MVLLQSWLSYKMFGLFLQGKKGESQGRYSLANTKVFHDT